MRADEGRSDVEKTIARIIESKFYITGGKKVAYYLQYDAIRQVMRVRLDCEGHTVSHRIGTAQAETAIALQISLMYATLAGSMFEDALRRLNERN